MLKTLARTDFAIDRATHTIRFTREFTVPPARVFEAWTQAEQVSCWWDADGAKLAACEIDLRIGGEFKFVHAGSGMVFSGTYQEIAAPNRLVFEAMGATGRVMLGESAGRTEMTEEITCPSAAHLDEFLRLGVAGDTARTLDNLVSSFGG